LNSKGGVGKTTITTTLAGTLQERGYAVLLVDADPQGSAVAWHHRRAEAERKSGHLACVQITRTTLDRDLASTNADYVVIDGSARLEKLSVSAIKAADVVLIPVQPSVLDLWDVSGTAALVKARQQAHGGAPRAAFVVSRQIPRTLLAQEVEEAVSALGLPLLKTRTTQRVAYPEAAVVGRTVGEYAPGSKADLEAAALTYEIIAFCHA